MLRVTTRCLLVLMGVSFASAAKPEFNLDFACGWDGCYRPMEWTPVEIGISSDLTAPFGGSLTISGPQDSQNNLHIVHPFVLTPNEAISVPLVTKMTFGIGQCGVTIRDEQGRTWAEQAIELWDASGKSRMLQTVRDPDMLIGVIGQPLFNVLRLSQEAVAMSSRGSGKVFVGHKGYRAVPWDWTGFVSLDLLVLYDPDWAQLRPEQVRAMGDWVSNGGTLLLILGSHPLPANSPLLPLLPFTPDRPRQVTIPEQVLSRWELDAASAQTVTAWPLSAKPGGLVVGSSEGSAELFGVGLVEFGRIAVLAFDPRSSVRDRLLAAGRSGRSASRHVWRSRASPAV